MLFILERGWRGAATAEVSTLVEVNVSANPAALVVNDNRG